jgi:hypothetical protein
LNEIIRLSTSGNIGFGTTTPNYKLDVVGDINYTGNLLKNGELVSQSESQWTTSVNDIYYTNGNVGIGSTMPNYKLDVVGDINYTGNLLKNGELVSQSESQWTTSVNDIYYTNGNVGIGTTNPQSLLHVNGQIYCNKIITTSDERLKKDITVADSEKCYTTLKNLPLKSFRWNNNLLNLPVINNEFRIGWIAQDVEQSIPNSVETISAYGLSDCKTINMDQIVALMYGTIQQLQKKIEEMEKLQFIGR